jgi:rod shape-determining protein MreD
VSAALRAAVLVFVAAMLQVSALSGGGFGGIAPDLLLVAVVLVGWNRGALVGAAGGFAGGLVADTVTLGRLGVSSLLLLLVGYWAGRYAETTGRGRAYAPYLAVVVATVGYAIAALLLTALLGDSVDAGRVFGPLVPVALFNLAVALLLHRLVRRLLGVRQASQAPGEVGLIG